MDGWMDGQLNHIKYDEIINYLNTDKRETDVIK